MLCPLRVLRVLGNIREAGVLPPKTPALTRLQALLCHLPRRVRVLRLLLLQIGLRHLLDLRTLARLLQRLTRKLLGLTPPLLMLRWSRDRVRRLATPRGLVQPALPLAAVTVVEEVTAAVVVGVKVEEVQFVGSVLAQVFAALQLCPSLRHAPVYEGERRCRKLFLCQLEAPGLVRWLAASKTLWMLQLTPGDREPRNKYTQLCKRSLISRVGCWQTEERPEGALAVS
jgi:hypothetical protein